MGDTATDTCIKIHNKEVASNTDPPIFNDKSVNIQKHIKTVQPDIALQDIEQCSNSNFR